MISGAFGQQKRRGQLTPRAPIFERQFMWHALSNPFTSEELLALVTSLQKELAALREENHRPRGENQALRDEMARLKGKRASRRWGSRGSTRKRDRNGV